MPTAFNQFSGSFPPAFLPAMNMSGPTGQMDPMAFFNQMGPADPNRPPPPEFWNPGMGSALPTPMESMPSFDTMGPPPAPKAKSASPPASDAFTPGSNVRGKQREKGAGPMRRGRARAATLDGTPKDLAMRHRMNNKALPLLEEDASSRIKSETSLAHKLTLHAKDMAKVDNQPDVDKWNILQPECKFFTSLY